MIMVTLSLLAPQEARASFDRYTDTIEPSLLDDIRLMASEMVANAVVHSGRPHGDPIEVETTFVHDMIRVEVTDQGQGAIPLTPRSISPPSGLHYLELLSDRWSSRLVNPFQVWFEIDTYTNTLIRRRDGAASGREAPPA